ncbi:MAG: succinate dehydrogenase assembly factor 2 [Gammaproteobacteria bacterium]|nr:succinate dehydrogenase assembly factor 2 [Gammaproteobacteria bacterium]
MSRLRPAEEKARLRWQCRRGLLELDFILGEFLEQHYDDLSDTLQQQFVCLLEQSDPDLQRWLMSVELTDVLELREVIGLIRRL